MENREYVEFLGWKGSYALFKIKRGELPNGRAFDLIIVACEGDYWIGRLNNREYDFYEDVQKALGTGLTFISKEYSSILDRSLFSYAFDKYESEAILAVPATGEEVYFEIYGTDSRHHYGIYPLVEREL